MIGCYPKQNVCRFKKDHSHSTCSIFVEICFCHDFNRFFSPLKSTPAWYSTQQMFSCSFMIFQFPQISDTNIRFSTKNPQFCVFFTIELHWNYLFFYQARISYPRCKQMLIWLITAFGVRTPPPPHPSYTPARRAPNKSRYGVITVIIIATNVVGKKIHYRLCKRNHKKKCDAFSPINRRGNFYLQQLTNQMSSCNYDLICACFPVAQQQCFYLTTVSTLCIAKFFVHV